MRKKFNRVIYKNWSLNDCIEIAKGCRNRTEFNAKHRAAYNAARLNGWLEEVSIHLNPVQKPARVGWLKSDYHAETLQYRTRKEHRIDNPASHATIYKNGWDKELFSHMERLKNFPEQYGEAND